MTFTEWARSYMVNGKSLADHMVSDEEWELLEDAFEAGSQAGYTEAVERLRG